MLDIFIRTTLHFLDVDGSWGEGDVNIDVRRECAPDVDRASRCHGVGLGGVHQFQGKTRHLLVDIAAPVGYTDQLHKSLEQKQLYLWRCWEKLGGRAVQQKR